MWLLWALLSAGAFGSILILQKVITIKSNNFRTGSVAFNMISTTLAMLLFVANGTYKNLQWPTNIDAYGYLVVAVLAYGIFERLRFAATSKVEVSEYAILGNTVVFVSMFMSIFLYQETLTPMKIIGTLLVILAIMLVSWRPNIRVIKKGVGFVIITEAILGVAYGLDKMGTLLFKPDLYNILVWALPLLVVSFPYVKLSDLVYEFKAGSWKILVMAFLNVGGYYASLKAFELADATRVIPIMQTSVFISVILGIALLKERDFLGRKLVGMAIAMTGAYLLSI